MIVRAVRGVSPSIQACAGQQGAMTHWAPVGVHSSISWHTNPHSRAPQLSGGGGALGGTTCLTGSLVGQGDGGGGAGGLARGGTAGESHRPQLARVAVGFPVTATHRGDYFRGAHYRARLWQI